MSTIRALSPTSVSRMVGQGWDVRVLVADSAGVPTGVVTGPDGVDVPLALTAADWLSANAWTATIIPAATGRYLATVGTESGAVPFVAYASPVTPDGGMPSLWDLVGDRSAEHPGYLGPTSWTDDEVSGALEAELAAQRRTCRLPAAYTADLREAALRRVARNLNMRRQPLAVLRGDAEGGEATRLPGVDPEVRRLERPYRRMPIG